MCRSLRGVAAAALLLCGGCALTEPYRREGGWRPSYASDSNLRVMAAVPSDLVRGLSDRRGDGQQVDAALERLRSGAIRKTADTAVAAALPSGSSESGK